jgi:parallel beta-helix repeat protein
MMKFIIQSLFVLLFAFCSLLTVSAQTYNPPTNVVPTALSQTQVKLTWRDNSTGETGFVVERSFDGTTWTNKVFLPPNATTYTYSSLSANTLYHFRVRLIGGGTNATAVTTPAPTPTPTPVPSPSPTTPTTTGTVELTGGVGGNRCSAYTAPQPNAPLRTLYVNASAGSDANNGTSPATAWRTLSKAVQTMMPGDLIYLRGTFLNQSIMPFISGTATNKIVFKKEPGYTATIENGEYEGGIYVVGQSHFVFDGIEVKNVPYPVQVGQGGNNIWFRNMHIHGGGNGVTFIGNADNNRVEDTLIENVGNVASNEGDGIILLDGSDNNVIVRNTIKNAGHDGINDTLQSNDSGTNSGNIIAHNRVNNRTSGGIITSGKTANVIVECNEVIDTSRDNPNAGSNMGIAVAGTNGIYRYNVVRGSLSHGIQILGYDFGGAVQSAVGNRIYHNTVVNNLGAGIQFANQDNGKVQNNIVENNLLSGNGGLNGTNGIYYDIVADNYNALSGSVWTTATAYGNIVRNNNISANKGFFVNILVGPDNLYYNAPTDILSVYGGWTGNVRVANPLFVNATGSDFRLQSGSPLVNIGVSITGQRFNGTAPDLGAFER